MFISRKLATGMRAQAEGDPPGRPPTPTGRGPRKEALFFCRHPPGWGEGGKDLLSLREAAMMVIRTVETWAPRSQWVKQTELSFFFFFFLQNHCWGGGSYCGGSGGRTPGLGESSSSPSVSSGSSAHVDGYRGGLPHGAINILFINVSGFSRQNYALFHGQKESKEV